ncbi:MAG: ABC transporter substrate-binding protein [Betaproteobacteria bacterium]|nr:ABC transporter substrate-binding protein [Betaproteobacteria bacterium]
MKINCILAGALVMLGLASSSSFGQASKPVRIGVMTDMAGMTSDLVGPGSVVAARMAVEDFGGKVAGRTIEVVIGDTQNKPDLASVMARRWFDAGGIDVIVDLPNSSVALAVLEVVKNAKKVVLLTAGASTVFSGKSCTPYSVQWSRDSYGLAQSIGSEIVRSGGDSWFFITADYAFGYATEAAVGQVVLKSGGKVLGSVKHPTGASDFSSFLLQAQTSKAKIIGMANAGSDTILAFKQAAEFGISKGGQRLVATYINLTDINSIGIKAAQGSPVVDTFYWDMNDPARVWSRRFFERHKRMPTSLQADVYSAVTHYLKAIQTTDPSDGAAVVKAMKAMPIMGPVLNNATIREDGRVIRDYYMFRVKAPEESKTPWDYYKLEQAIPGDKLVIPLADSECPMVKKPGA